MRLTTLKQILHRRMRFGEIRPCGQLIGGFETAFDDAHGRFSGQINTANRGDGEQTQ
jgi:hypothetical protein